MMTQETLREAVAKQRRRDIALIKAEIDRRVAEERAKLFERLRTPSDNVIWAGIEARDKCEQAMRDREKSDNPENMPDYDEGDVAKFMLQAMLTAFQQENSDER